MGVGDTMTTINLRDEIVAALNRSAPRDDLLTIVLRHKERGVSQRVTYDTLQSVWIERGCNEGEDNRLCESLEDVMDRVWGFCPARDAIWDSSLTEAPGE
jgi:hypothetical protein